MKSIKGLSPLEVQGLFGFHLQYMEKRPNRRVELVYSFDNFVTGIATLIICSDLNTFKWKDIEPFKYRPRNGLARHGIGTLATIMPLEKLLEEKELSRRYAYERGDFVSPRRLIQYSKAGIDIASPLLLDEYLEKFKVYARQKGFKF